MTNLTQFAAGATATTTPAFAPADFNILANGASVLSSIAQFDNTAGAMGQFADLTFVSAIASSTIITGAGVGFYLGILESDGTTIGDGRLTAGAGSGAGTVYSPLLNPIGGIPVQAGTTITKIAGAVLGIVLPLQKFSFIMQNTVGFAFAGTNTCFVTFYRQNLNT